MVTQDVEKDHRAWAEHIPAGQFAYHTALPDATGYTPAFLNYGHELRGPEDTDQLTAEHDAPDNLRSKLTEACELVRI